MLRDVTRTAPTRQAIQDEIDGLLRIEAEDAGELLLVRHAEPAHTDTADPMLSCTGLDQAERLAARLDAAGFGAVYCAPERRAQQTARIVAGTSGRDLHVLDALADIEFDPARAPNAESPVNYAEPFVQTPRWDALPGFECGKQFRRRAVQAIERILAINQARRIVVVTHTSVISAYVSMLLSIPADQFFAPEYTSVSVVRWRQGSYALRALNDSSHLSSAFDTSVRADL
jgi:broad specificity phosphatase PhoE